MPTITQLQYLLSVSETGHFGRAAEECHVSQPSLSAQIQKVEEELGLIIFDRSKKPILVTEAGKRILEQARRVIHEHKQIFNVVHDSGEIAGDFHLGVIPTLAPYVVPLFVEQFAAKYPKVNLKISEFQTATILRMLHEDSIDGGLLVTPLGDDRLIERSLFYEPFYVFTSKTHAFFKRKTLKETDLDSSSVWLLDEGHCFRSQVLRLCSSKNRNQVLDSVAFASGNLETLINLVRRGKGFTLLPHLATLNLHKEEISKNLKKFTRPIPTREVSLVHSRSFLKEGILDALADCIMENVPKELTALKRGHLDVVDI